MLKITAKIKFGTDGGTITAVSGNVLGINVSSTLTETIGKREQTQHPFILGSSRLGGGDCYTKKSNYFIGRELSDSNGEFPYSYDITVSGTDITKIAIVFNKQKNEYPKSILVDGEAFYDDDATWAVSLTSADTHSITISNWNTPNSPLVITSIYADLSITLDETNLLDFERSSKETNDEPKLSFGIISNTGSLSFIDPDGEVSDLITQNPEFGTEGIIEGYLENTETGAKVQIANFFAETFTKDNSAAIITATFKDDFEDLQEISFEQIHYIPTKSTSQTAEWLYNYLYEQTPSKYNIPAFEELDYITQGVLRNTTIKYPVLESDNLWNAWNKLSELCLLQIYMRGDGKVSVQNVVIPNGVDVIPIEIGDFYVYLNNDETKPLYCLYEITDSGKGGYVNNLKYGDVLIYNGEEAKIEDNYLDKNNIECWLAECSPNGLFVNSAGTIIYVVLRRA